MLSGCQPTKELGTGLAQRGITRVFMRDEVFAVVELLLGCNSLGLAMHGPSSKQNLAVYEQVSPSVRDDAC